MLGGVVKRLVEGVVLYTYAVLVVFSLAANIIRGER